MRAPAVTELEAATAATEAAIEDGAWPASTSRLRPRKPPTRRFSPAPVTPDPNRRQKVAETDFPDGFRGAGPMYAAIPLGTPWLNAATDGLTTYVLEAPYGYPAEMSDEAASAAYDAYAGYSAFLDRGQAEAIADARGDGTFARFDGLTGHWDYSPAAAREMREADEEFTAGLESPGAES
jgi:hypothetical protein